MNTNKILAGNLEEALSDAIAFTQQHELAMGFTRPSAYLVGLQENLKRFREGEHLEIDYTTTP